MTTCTLITATKPTIVGKEFHLNTDQKLTKVTTAFVSEGQMEIKEFEGLNGFAVLLQTLDTNQCLAYGCPSSSPVNLVTEKMWDEQGRPETSLPRSKKTFHWPAEPGILMVDYDAPKEGNPLSKHELISSLREACPGLRDAAMIWWPSTSSCIFNGDTELTGVKGQRLYIEVLDASDIPRTGAAILTYLWANGVGRYEVSKSGSMLERGLFDGSVWQSNRIDFAAGAKCHDGLEQKRGEPELISGLLQIIDTKLLIPEPNSDVIALAEANKAIAKAKVSADATKSKEIWIQERVTEITNVDKNIPTERAESTARRAVENKVLTDDWPITVKMVNGSLQKFTISQILNNPQANHGLLTLDPLEPNYDGGRVVGKLYLTGAYPRLHSLAHGGVTFKLTRKLILIEIEKGNESKTTDLTLDVLRAANDVFDFGPGMVMIGARGSLVPLNEHALRYLLGGKLQYWRWHQLPKGGAIECLENPPAGVCRSILSLGTIRKLKRLDAVITAPTLRQDGSVLNSLGYDPTTRLLLDSEEYFPPIYEYPTRSQAITALEQVLKPFTSFPFFSELDRAILLAAILTAAVRPILGSSPAFAFDAPVQGSGKTLVARCTGVLTTGKDPDIWPHTAGRDDEEIRKRLFTALLSGARAVVWDNIIGTFDSAAMASLLTSDAYCDRVLGKSEAASVPNRALILMTGNNISLAGDMPRRVLVCRIDPQTDRPFAREFDLDPLAYCLENRQEMIAAALTLIRFYLSSGTTRPGAGRMASFEKWDDWVRQTILYIKQQLMPDSFGDVMDQVQANQASDPEQEALGALLQAWYIVFDEERVTVSEVLQTCQKNTCVDSRALENALKELFNGRGELSAKSLGRILKYRKDRIVGGFRLEQSGDINGSSLWRIRRISIDAITTKIDHDAACNT